MPLAKEGNLFTYDLPHKVRIKYKHEQKIWLSQFAESDHIYNLYFGANYDVR